MSKKKKPPAVTADPKAVSKINDQVLEMMDVIPKGLEPYFGKRAVLELIYNRRTTIDIPIPSRIRSETESHIWLNQFISPVLKGWKKFNVRKKEEHFKGDRFVIYLEVKT